MSKKTIIEKSSVGKRRVMVGALHNDLKTVLDGDEVMLKSGRVVQTEDGRKPEPVEQPSRRELVAIKAGQLVRVRGDRDGKYLVTKDPDHQTRTKNGRSWGKVVVVDLLGPDGIPTQVPLRMLVPIH
jgi:hypothetical protein